jgi:REP element-mobilizing transposase RayT
MPRNTRVFVPQGIYHVYCRVARSEPVFDDRDLAEYWIDALALVGGQHHLTILAWCLMANHYHLVVQTGVDPLWKPMARFQVRVAKEHNRRRNVNGHLWQSRYKARIVTEQAYLNHLFAYVHLNPVAAGIVDDPADYPYSGHRAMIGIERSRLLDVRTALAVFGSDPKSALSSYQAFLRAVSEARWLRAEVRWLPWWKVVTDDEQTLRESEAPAEASAFDGQPLPPERALRPPLSLVLAKFEESQGIPDGRLTGPTRTRQDALNRCVFSTFAVSWLGYSSKEVAAVLEKNPSSVSRWLAEGLRLQRTGHAFRDELEVFCRHIADTIVPLCEHCGVHCEL